MNVIRPTNNSLVRGFSSEHKGYDFAGVNLPDEVRAGADGVVVETVNLYTTAWRNTGVLTTRDYGNYIIVKHADGTKELHAHLTKDSMLSNGTSVKAGQTIARIGHTGNSTGKHLHSEYRNTSNVPVAVNFINYTPLPIPLPVPPTNTMDNRAFFFDLIFNSGSGFNFGTTDSKQVTEGKVKEFIAWVKSNRDRAGKYDKAALLAYGAPIDTNALTPEQLIAQARKVGADTNAIREEGRQLGMKQVKDAANAVR